MKRKWQLITTLLLALAVSGGLFAYAQTTATATIDVMVKGDIATCEPAPAESQPDWNSIVTPVVDTEILRPNAAGDETNISDQFPAAGEHWDKVDEEISDGDTTYVYTSNADWQEDLYHMADSTGSGTINYVRVYMAARATDTPTQSSAYVHIKTGGVEYNGSQVTVTTSYATYSYQWDTNPQTLAAWTWAEIDALQIGVGLRQTKTTGAPATRQTQCTQVYAEVSYSHIPLCGDVPTGDLFDITPEATYTGDLAVKVYLVNTGALVKAYQYLNMKLYLEGSVEAGETPNYRLLTLQNGEVIFHLENHLPGTYTLSVTGGSYCLVSNDPTEWETGWTVEPEFYCEIMQR